MAWIHGCEKRSATWAHGAYDYKSVLADAQGLVPLEPMHRPEAGSSAGQKCYI
jgi:hypothetical protein